MSATTRFTDPTLPEPPALYPALEVSNRSWKLAFSIGHGQRPPFRNVPARDLDALTREIALARTRFGLPDSVPVISCYEAGLAGFTPTPYQSGDDSFDQGISKAGSSNIRALTIQIAWGRLLFQPQSALTLWYQRRFASRGPRMRKIGIVALARRLLIDLWRFSETGSLPEGAITSS